MKQQLIVLLVLTLLAGDLSAQFIDFPAGYGNVPKDKLKGPVRTVLTIEQRGEHVFSTVVETFDEEGRLIEVASSNANIEVHSGKLYRGGGKTIMFYDSSGRRSRERRYDPDSSLAGSEIHTYDAAGRLIESKLLNKDGKDRGFQKYVYLPAKKEVEASWSFYQPGSRGVVTRSVLTYDDRNRWISRTLQGGTKDHVTFEYDPAGNLVKVTHSNHWYEYSYKFDARGNWIERENTYFQYGKSGEKEASPGYMNAYRVITYYPDHKND